MGRFPAIPGFSHSVFIPSSYTTYIYDVYLYIYTYIYTAHIYFFFLMKKQHGAASLRSSWRSMSGTATTAMGSSSMSMSMSTSHGQGGVGSGTDLASRSYDGSLASLAASSSKGSNRTAVAARTGRIEVRECPEVCVCHFTSCGILVRVTPQGACACHAPVRAMLQCVSYSRWDGNISSRWDSNIHTLVREML